MLAELMELAAQAEPGYAKDLNGQKPESYAKDSADFCQGFEEVLPTISESYANDLHGTPLRTPLVKPPVNTPVVPSRTAPRPDLAVIEGTSNGWEAAG